jgi:mRNA interferase MazF
VLAETTLDLTVCFITTNIGWTETLDVLLAPSSVNGLRKPSLVRTSKIATLDRSLAKGLLGRLTLDELTELNNQTQNIITVNLIFDKF